MKVLRKAAAMQRLAETLRREGLTIGVVPTMGALHEGHLSLVRAARRENDIVITTIFVNPAQFGPGEDLSRYPRALRGDCAKLRAESCDVVFAPGSGEIYPDQFQTYVVPGDLASRLEGQSRPHHFRGVTTVCLKLFQLTRPHRAYFGRKDYQQLQIVRRMVRDLNLDLVVRERPIVRDADGLALSSRNRYLSDRQRQTALALHRALEAQARNLRKGLRPQTASRRGREALSQGRGLKVDYFEVCDSATLLPARSEDTDLVILGAIRVGRTRLIDNVRVRLKSAR